MFLSIILPVYNPTRIKRLFDSIEKQSNKDDFELVIVNDCGNDNYLDLLNDYTFNFLNLTTPYNIGQGLARQYGIDNCNGEWITFLDHDDELTYDILKKVVEDIKISECEFLYSTQSIICNDYDWLTTQMYMVEDSPAVLHGHFYKKEKLKKYNIKFSEKIRAQEDTYYLMLVNGHIVRDKENYIEDKTIVKSPLITYIWYLWDDSQSHSYVEGDKKHTEISYLEHNLCDYIYAVYTAYKEVENIYGYDADFTYMRCCSALFYLYWFEQAFQYINPYGYKKENLKHIKDFRDKVMEEDFKLSNVNDLTNLLLDMPDLFYVAYQSMLTNVDEMFIPRQTIEQFYQNL